MTKKRTKRYKKRSKRKPIECAKTYEERNQLLKELGFSSYPDYLGSALWASIRARHFRHKRNCFRCGGRAAHLHHWRYTRENLAGLSERFLLPACTDCRELLEFDGEGGKLPLQLTMDQTTSIMKERARLRAKKGQKYVVRMRVPLESTKGDENVELVCVVDGCTRTRKSTRHEHCPEHSSMIARLAKERDFDFNCVRRDKWS